MIEYLCYRCGLAYAQCRCEFKLGAMPESRQRSRQVSVERQRMLLSGLDCLPNQTDLFKTDGGEE